MALSCERKSGKSDLPLEPCPWLVYFSDQNQLFWSLSHPHQIYIKSIPAFFGDSEVVAHASGWFLLSQNDTHFSLWNPSISDSFIHLPPLSLKPSQEIKHYFLSSPPGDPDCKVLLFDNVLGSIIVIRPEAPHNEWTHIHYAESVTYPGGEKTKNCLKGCVSLNGKLYASTFHGRELVTLNVDKANKLVIEPLCKMPEVMSTSTGGTIITSFFSRLVECCGELLYVYIVFGGSKMDKLSEVHVFKLDFVRMIWKRAQSLMGQAVFLDAVGASFFNPAFGKGIEADSIYFTVFGDKALYSFNVTDGCLSVTVPCPTIPSSWSSMIFVPHDWLSRNSNLPPSREEQGEKIDEKEESNTEIVHIEETSFLDLPLESPMISADCLIPNLQHRQALQRFKTCHSSSSSSSPMWLLLSINDLTVFKFVDPIHGTSFIMSVPESLKGSAVRYSRNGWLLMSDGESSISFLNPFTEEIIKLPAPPERECASCYAMAFSSLPTSPDCVVIGCGAFPPTDTTSELRIVVTTMEEHNEWLHRGIEHDAMFWLDNSSPVFYKGCFYLLDLEGTLSVLNYYELEIDLEIHWTVSWNILRNPRTPCSSSHQNFLLECDGKLMSIFVGEMERWLEIYILDFNGKCWENVKSIGNYVIYVSRS